MRPHFTSVPTFYKVPVSDSQSEQLSSEQALNEDRQDGND